MSGQIHYEPWLQAAHGSHLTPAYRDAEQDPERKKRLHEAEIPGQVEQNVFLATVQL